MNKLTAMTGLSVLGVAFSSGAEGYGTTAHLYFSWGYTGTDIGWSSLNYNSVNTLTGPMSNSTYFSTLSGSNLTNYYNSDFATASQCASLVADLGGTAPNTRKYGCRYFDDLGSQAFVPNSTPTVGAGNEGPAATAHGYVTVTDTTMTGVLTIVSTTDEPTGGTATSIGTGTNGYNLRTADGSPFGNSWNGVTTLGTYTLALTGTFTASSWQITGGGARFNDPGFLCQQGGNSAPANVLCLVTSAPGAYSSTGGSLSWGWELDGAATNLGNAMGGIDVRGADNALLTTLSGVLADLSVDASGNLTTNQAEIRRALGRSIGCGLGSTTQNISYNADLNSISCGTLTTSRLEIYADPRLDYNPLVPIPPAALLFGSALGLMGVMRRKVCAIH